MVFVEHKYAYAAGLLEGEGCFTLVKNYKAKRGMTPKLVVQMNDLDVLQTLACIYQCGRIYYRPPRKNSKESWSWTVYKASDLLRIIELFKPFAGQRRLKKLEEILAWMKDTQ
jgi:hypothetical protein